MNAEDRILTALMGAGRAQDVPMIARWCGVPYKELNIILAGLCKRGLVSMIHRKAGLTRKGRETMEEKAQDVKPRIIYREKIVEKVVKKQVPGPVQWKSKVVVVERGNDTGRAQRIYNRSAAQNYMKNKTK